MESAIDPMVGGCDPRHQIEVHAALALSLVYTEGNSETHDYIGRFVSDTSTLCQYLLDLRPLSRGWAFASGICLRAVRLRSFPRTR